MKPSWVLSEDERQRRFRKNRDRGGSHDQTSLSSHGLQTQSDLSQEYKVDLDQPEPQVDIPQNLPVIKKENTISTTEQTKVESIPLSSLTFNDPQLKPSASLQQPMLMKSEVREPSSYLALSPATTSHQQAAILLLTNHQPSAVIVPATNYVSNMSGVTISTTSSSQASVIVQPVHRKTEDQEGKEESRQVPAATSVEVIATTVRTEVQRSGYKLEEDADWDSNYEDDIFTSDEEEEHRSMHALHNNEPEVKFSQDEFYHLESLVKAHNDKYRSVNFGEELIKEMIMCSMFGIPVSTSAAINGYRLTVERITRIAHNLECFTDLNKTDQSHLLMENADLLVNLRGAIFFDSRKKGVNQILISMGIGKYFQLVEQIRL